MDLLIGIMSGETFENVLTGELNSRVYLMSWILSQEFLHSHDEFFERKFVFISTGVVMLAIIMILHMRSFSLSIQLFDLA